MPYDPSQLPDLRGDYETADQKLKRQLDELAGLLGNNFSWKSGIQYDNGKLRANLSNRGIRASYPLFGGDLDAKVTNIGSGDPYYSLRFIKNFK
jgi:hypothetical protein